MKRQVSCRNWTILLDQPPEGDWKILSISVSFVSFFFKQFYKKAFRLSWVKTSVLVGALSEEEDEWDKVSIALALTPDRSTALQSTGLFYCYFSLGKPPSNSQPLILLLFSLKNSPQWGLQYLMQKGTLNVGHPLMSKSFVTSRNWFHDVAAIPLSTKWEWDKAKLLELVRRKCLGQVVYNSTQKGSKDRWGMGMMFSWSELLNLLHYRLWSQNLLKKKGLGYVLTNSSSNTSCFYLCFSSQNLKWFSVLLIVTLRGKGFRLGNTH